MKKGLTSLLKVLIFLIGIGAIALLLWEPQLEGRNANATLFEIYFQDPFLAYMYLGSVPFFVGLYQAFKLLGFIEQNKTFSADSVITLRKIKYSAVVIIGFIIGAIVWIRTMSFISGDDPAGAIAIGLVIIFICTVVATFAAVLQKLFQNAIDIKSENDLTV